MKKHFALIPAILSGLLPVAAMAQTDNSLPFPQAISPQATPAAAPAPAAITPAPTPVAPQAQASSFQKDPAYQNCSGIFANGTPPIITAPAIAKKTKALCNNYFAGMYSGYAKSDVWAAERLTPQSVEAARNISSHNLRRTYHFHPDARLTIDYQSQLTDYYGSGMDRGHLVPAGDAPTPADLDSTFALSNITPQTAALNRHPLEDIEKTIRNIGSKGETFVVTGPAYHAANGQIGYVGANKVYIPTAIWKSVWSPSQGLHGTYVCRNSEQPTCTITPISEQTRVTGIDAFPTMPADLKQAAPNLPRP